MKYLVTALMALALLPATAQAAWTNLGTHPSASAQSTGTGKVLTQLEDFGSKIYVGFGDGTANTGPIDMRPWDVTNSVFATNEISLDTECAWQFRTIGTDMYAPSCDPRTSADYGKLTSGGTWTNPDKTDMAHVFDIQALGSDLFLIGQGSNDHAVVYRSTDGGSTFSSSLDVAPNGVGSTFARFYGGAVVGSNLYVQPWDDVGGATGQSLQKWNGTSWSTQTGITNFNRAITFGSVSMIVGGDFAGQNGPAGQPLYKFDGSTATATGPDWVNNYDVFSSTIYGLFGDGKIRTSTDGTNWTLWGNAPAGDTRSIAVTNSYIYVGRTDSKLYRSAR